MNHQKVASFRMVERSLYLSVYFSLIIVFYLVIKTMFSWELIFFVGSHEVGFIEVLWDWWIPCFFAHKLGPFNSSFELSLFARSYSIFSTCNCKALFWLPKSSMVTRTTIGPNFPDVALFMSSS